MSPLRLLFRTRIAWPCALLALTLLAAGRDPQAGAAPSSKMPTASGRITYQMSGPMKGSMVLSWTENGKKFRQDTKLTGTPPMPPGAGAPKAPMKMESWVLSDGKDIYTVMPMAGKRALRLKGVKGAAGPTGAPLGLGQMLGDAASAKGSKVVGKGTVLGKPCEIRSAKGGKAWVWQGIPLRMEIQMAPNMPMMKVVATRVESAPKLSASLFKVPAGYQIQDMDVSKRGAPGMPPGGHKHP